MNVGREGNGSGNRVKHVGGRRDGRKEGEWKWQPGKTCGRREGGRKGRMEEVSERRSE